MLPTRRKRESEQKKGSRKEPKQARAQATVHAILEATELILNREGSDSASTTRIAETAGVSVGSLYQYFADRDAILNALQEREFERAVGMMQVILAEGNLARTPRETVTAVVRGLAQLYSGSPGLHRVLAIEGLRVAAAERVHAFDLRVVGIIAAFLAATDAPLRKTNVNAAAFVAFQSVRATMLATLLERPAEMSEEDLTSEIVDLILRYLVHDTRDLA
jgi:AcrR family transcriptional regulator